MVMMKPVIWARWAAAAALALWSMGNERKARSERDAMAGRKAQTEQRLRAQYTALDTKLGQLSAIGAYVSQQMAVFTNSSKS